MTTIYAALHRRDKPVRPQIVLGQYVDDGARLELCRALWGELHAKENPSPEWFKDWLSRVPSFGCSCRKDFAAYLATNPPRYDDWYAWTVEAHNFVNQKLNKPIWNPLDSYKAIA